MVESRCDRALATTREARRTVGSPPAAAPLVIIVAAVLACGGDGTGPVAGDALDVRSESANYVYLSSSADAATIDTVWQEHWHAWVLGRLEVSNPWRIEFRKYRDLAHMKRMTGHDDFAWAETRRRRFHTIWPEDSHEATHVLWKELVGDSPSFFSEGIAVAFHGDPINRDFARSTWNGENIHVVARGLLASGAVPAADRLLVTNDFWDIPPNTGYPVAGSFVHWLVDTYGIERLKAFTRTVDRDDDASRIRQRFREAFGEGFDACWQAWQAFLDGV